MNEKKSLKIVFTIISYKPDTNGVELVTSYLAEGLAKKGHKVFVITSSYTNKTTPNKECISGVNIIRIPLKTVHTVHKGNKKEYQNLILEVCKDADCLINVCTQIVTTDWCMPILNKLKCKKILYLHSIIDFKWNKMSFSSFKYFISKVWNTIRWGIYYNFNKSKFKQYDEVTQLHDKDYSYDYFIKKYNIKSKIMENAAEDYFFITQDTTEFRKPFEKYIINVSNYGEIKNQKLAVEQFLKSDIEKGIGLVLIGSKKNIYYDETKKLIENLRIKYNLNNDEKPILMLDNIDRRLIPLYVQNASIYLLTSKWEAFPISLLEAMASKLPFISTDVGIVKYLCEGKVVNNDDDIHYWIEKFMQDEELRKSIGEASYIYAKNNCKVSDKVNEFEKIIEKERV